MVRRLLSLLDREIRGLHEAAYILATFTLLSQVLALIRDRTFAHLFGAGSILDTYFAAFRVPDLVFALLTLFVSSFALVPLLAKRSKDDQGALIGSTLALFGASAIAVTVGLYIAAPYIVPYMVPGFAPADAAHVLMLARIMLLQPILLGISSIAASVVQASRRFVLFALAPIMYNLGIILGAVFLYPLMGIAGLAWGVVLGATLHCMMQCVPLVRGGGALPLRVHVSSLMQTLRDVVIPSVPRSVALMGNQGLLVAFSAIASLVSVGAVAALSFAFNLQSVPLTVIGVSYASALFPALSEMHARADMAAFTRELWATVRHVSFWLLPATMFAIVLRAHMVRVVLGSGAFSWDDTRLTAALVAVFAVSLFAQALILIFSRAYYALGRTLTPILLNVGGALVTAALACWLVETVGQDPFLRVWFEALFRIDGVEGTLALMIPAAYSLVMSFVALGFAILLAREGLYEKGSLSSFGISFSASVIGAGVAYLALNAFGPLLPTHTFLGIFAQGVGAGALGCIGWLGILYLLRSRELSDIAAVVYQRLVSPRRS